MMAKKCFSLVFGLLVTIYVVTCSKEVQASDYEEEDGAIYDPSVENLVLGTEVPPVTTVKMPDSCQNKSFCFEKGPDYPEDKIAYLIKSISNWAVDRGSQQSVIGDRYGPGDPKDCPEYVSNDPIYYINDTNGDVRVVLQLKDKFEQIYTVRWCRNPGLITEDTPHFLKGSAILEEFKLECVDATMAFKFFVLRDDVDSETGKPAPKIETAWVNGGIPVCCRCRYDPKV